MKYFDMNFISQNTAPYNAKNITIFDSNNKVGKVQLGRLRLPVDIGEKLYSCGIFADAHVQYETATEDLERALTYIDSSDCLFSVIDGDLTENGTTSQLEQYKTIVSKFNKSIYAIAGNHDASETESLTPVTLTKDGITPYTGYPLYYSFTQGNDVFIMVGQRRWDSYNGVNTDPFSTEELQWFYETLEANRNKRCFVFQHLLRFDGCGNPYAGLYPTVNLMDNTQGEVFKSLVSHYPNVIWFHGHSHTSFGLQSESNIANYDRLYGCHSVHVPSLAVPRDIVNGVYEGQYAESEGYIMDVYENHIVLRGRDFIKGEFLPIATYCLDTTLVNIEANTFADSTGTITTISDPFAFTESNWTAKGSTSSVSVDSEGVHIIKCSGNGTWAECNNIFTRKAGTYSFSLKGNGLAENNYVMSMVRCFDSDGNELTASGVYVPNHSYSYNTVFKAFMMSTGYASYTFTLSEEVATFQFVFAPGTQIATGSELVISDIILAEPS